MKRARIDAFFPDVKGCPTISATGQGSSARVAIAKAMAQVLGAPRLKRKQWQAIRTMIIVTNATERRADGQDEVAGRNLARAVKSGEQRAS